MLEKGVDRARGIRRFGKLETMSNECRSFTTGLARVALMACSFSTRSIRKETDPLAARFYND